MLLIPPLQRQSECGADQQQLMRSSTAEELLGGCMGGDPSFEVLGSNSLLESIQVGHT